MDRIPLSDETVSLDEDLDFDPFADDVTSDLDFGAIEVREYDDSEVVELGDDVAADDTAGDIFLLRESEIDNNRW